MPPIEVIAPGHLPPAPAGKVRMKATAFGVFTGGDGTIHHFNPEADNERYTYPLIPEADVPKALERGLGERATGSMAKKLDEAGEGDPNALEKVAAARAASTGKIDAETNSAPSALDSRQSTAWARPDIVQGGAEGQVDRLGDDAPIIGDADAAPAPKALAKAASKAPASTATKPVARTPRLGKPAKAATPAAPTPAPAAGEGGGAPSGS